MVMQIRLVQSGTGTLVRIGLPLLKWLFLISAPRGFVCSLIGSCQKALLMASWTYQGGGNWSENAGGTLLDCRSQIDSYRFWWEPCMLWSWGPQWPIGCFSFYQKLGTVVSKNELLTRERTQKSSMFYPLSGCGSLGELSSLLPTSSSSWEILRCSKASQVTWTFQSVLDLPQDFLLLAKMFLASSNKLHEIPQLGGV